MTGDGATGGTLADLVDFFTTNGPFRLRFRDISEPVGRVSPTPNTKTKSKSDRSVTTGGPACGVSEGRMTGSGGWRDSGWGRALDSASGRVPVAVVKPATAERN